MSNSVAAVLSIDTNYDLHIARIMILLGIVLEKENERITGITKLVKMDFLLRYPTVLSKALPTPTSRKSGYSVEVKDHEKQNVEAGMIRFKYGPWDRRYRLFLAILESKGLIKITYDGKTIEIAITNRGKEIAMQLSDIVQFKDYVDRSKIINAAFKKTTGTGLANMIYRLIPELSTMTFGEKIGP